MQFYKFSLALALILAIGFKGNDALQCYVCDGDDCNEAVLEACSEDTPTVPTTAPTTESTTESTIVTTTGDPNTATTTTPTTVDPGTTTTPTTVDPGTTTTPTTVDAGTTTTPTTVDAGTTTTPTTVDPAATEPAPEKKAQAAAVRLLRLRRALSETNISQNSFLSNYVSPDPRSSASACYSILIKSGEEWKPKKGCVLIPSGTDACDAIREENNLTASSDDECTYCYNDGCNSSAALQISIVAFILTMTLKYLF